jgi:hypothetical protein
MDDWEDITDSEGTKTGEDIRREAEAEIRGITVEQLQFEEDGINIQIIEE